MRVCIAVPLTAATALVVCLAAPAAAAPGRSTNTDTDQRTGTIIPTANQVGWSGGGSSGPRCTWTLVPEVGGVGDDGQGSPNAGSGAREVGRTVNGVPQRLYLRSNCSDGRADGLFWVPTVSVTDVREDAHDQVARQLPLPSPDMSPDPAVGGYVNLGLWLAVEDPGPVSATAAVGPVWVTITAQYSSTTWDMGTGESFECDGLGTPIVDTDTSEEGPCGFTYDNPSAPRFTGGGLAYEASVTGTWAITWVDYTGATGVLGPLARTTEFDYRVREIQTVGVSD